MPDTPLTPDQQREAEPFAASARMKQAGMRWGTHGADHVGDIRGLFRGETGQWDAFWSRN